MTTVHRISRVTAATLLVLGATVLAIPVAQADDKAPTASFLGDSYTQGAGASRVAARWSTLVAQKMGWTERNLGRGGTGYVATSGANLSYRDRIDDVVASNPMIVVVSGGVNDMAAYQENSALVAQAISETYLQIHERLPTARVIAIGPSPPVSIATPQIASAFDHDVALAALAIGAQYVSLLAPYPVIRQEMVLPDRTHVDDAGHAAIADRVLFTLTQS